MRALPTTDRRRPGSERQVTALAIAFAGGFLGLTVISFVVPGSGSLGAWLPTHLLLAGAATTAIAGVMPFFSAAVANAPPAPAGVRLVAVIGVAAGALLVVGGRLYSPALAGPGAWLAGAGGLVFIGGLVMVGVATLAPLRAALGPRRIVMGSIYGVAIVNVICGAALASLLLLGWLPVLEGWGALKPAHAWLNVFGFVSLVIAGSLLHLLPTVVGARISRTRASVVCFAGVASGPPIAALGFLLGSDPLAVAGAGVLVIGALGLAAHAVHVMRHRATWSTDPEWHRFTTWSLVAAIAWFVIGTLLAAWDVIAGGASPAGWRLVPLIPTIGVGWVAQVLMGAWSHLVPAVGPGSPGRHAAQRRILGTLATARLVLLNAGLAALALGGGSVLLVAGAVSVVVCLAGAVALLAAALLTPEPER